MKVINFIIFMVFISSCSWAKTLNPNNISDLKWKNRIIIAVYSHQNLQALTVKKPEVDDRDIIWFLVNDNNIHTNYRGELSSSFSQSVINYYENKGSKAILMGKDGKIKLKQNTLNVNNMFSLIDTMPMRIIEMQNNT